MNDNDNKEYDKIMETQNQKVEQMFSINFLNAENTAVTRTEGGLMSATVNGVLYKRVRPVRCFPFTEPDGYISLREGGGNDSREIGMLRNIGDLGEEAERILREQLDVMYFMPIIKKIFSIREEYGYSYWDVLTDRGQARFTVRMGGNSINKLTGSRIIISDLDANRFEIPDITELSSKELKMLDLYL